MKKPYIIGVGVSGTRVTYGLFDNRGAIVYRRQHPTNTKADGSEMSDQIVENISVLLRENNLSSDNLKGVGVCMPSHILYDEGVVLMTSAMPAIKDFRMRDYLRERLHTTVMLDNSASGASLAEHRHGAGRGARHMVYIKVGAGLGSGIIIDGNVFKGSYGWAGEIGHMLCTPDEGVLCGCENKGCFMSYVAGKNIPDRVKAGIDKGIKSILTPDSTDGYLLNEAYKAGDPLASYIIDLMANHLAVCVFNVYQMLNINTYVFGGRLANFGGVFLELVRKEFNKYNHIQLPVHFRLAELDQDIGIIGAAEMIEMIDDD